jgi:hypothetical protein
LGEIILPGTFFNSIDEKFRKDIEKTRLIKLVLIFSGHEAIYIDECH